MYYGSRAGIAAADTALRRIALAVSSENGQPRRVRRVFRLPETPPSVLRPSASSRRPVCRAPRNAAPRATPRPAERRTSRNAAPRASPHLAPRRTRVHRRTPCNSAPRASPHSAQRRARAAKICPTKTRLSAGYPLPDKNRFFFLSQATDNFRFDSAWCFLHSSHFPCRSHFFFLHGQLLSSIWILRQHNTDIPFADKTPESLCRSFGRFSRYKAAVFVGSAALIFRY